MAYLTLDEAMTILQGDLTAYSESDRNEAIRVAEDNGLTELAQLARKQIEMLGLSENLDDESNQIYVNNNDDLSHDAENYTFDDFISAPENQILAEAINNTSILDSDRKTVLDEDKKKEYLNLLFQSAKLDTETYLTGNTEFSAQTRSQKNETFKEELRAIFFSGFANVAIASKMDKPTSKEQEVNSPEYHDYIQRQAKKAQEIFRNIIEGGRKITVHVDSILSSVADTAVRTENYVRSLRNKAENMLRDKKDAYAQDIHDKWLKIANKIQLKKNKLEAKAKAISDNRYEILKNIKGSIKDNAYKISTNLAANVGAGLWMSSAVASGGTVAPALIAYGAYHAASSWVWPVVKEYRKINRERKEQKQPKLGFKAALKEAWKNTTTGKNKKKYLISGSVNSVLGVALMGWGSHILGTAHATQNVVESVNNATSAATMVAGTRATLRVAKTTAATGAQLIDAAVNKEKATAYAALAGGALSYFMIGDGVNANAAETNILADNNDTVTPEIKTDEVAEVVQTPKPEQTTTVIDETSVTPSENQDVVETTDDIEFPREYSKETGLSQREFNILLSTTEGSLKLATGDEVTLDNAYANLNDDAMEHFPGKTREMVIYKFNRLYAFMRKAYEAGDGTLRETPSGAEYLEQKFGSMNLKLDENQMSQLVSFAQENTYADKKNVIQGLKEMFPDEMDRKTMTSVAMAIHSNQRFYQNAAEMEALIKLLGCGDQITAEQGQAINAMLDRSDEILSQGKSNTQLIGLSLSKGCEDDDGEWRHVGGVKTPAPMPKIEAEAEPEPVMRKIEKVSISEPQVSPIDLGPAKAPENLEINTPKLSEPEPTPEPEPEKKPMKVRKVLTQNYFDFETGDATRQETLSDADAAKYLKKLQDNANQGR